MAFPKRTFDKPIPVSPLIALDRERCILCYRCTRFSQEVAEDGQLVARNRGAQSVIATFQDEPYRGRFSGNVIELCPVGALTSTTYRFEARPWEIQNVPTVCGMCPVGCNISATIREGKLKRILSRNHPEVDGGWLCDKGRFAYGHLHASDRIVDPLRRGRPRYEELDWDTALDEAERLLRAAGTRIVTALSGSETVETAYALAKLLRQGLGAHCAVLPEEVDHAMDAVRAPLSSIGDADLVVILGDEPVAERAPIVDLWIKLARRKGAEILHELDEPRIRAAENAVLIWSGDASGGAEVASLAKSLGCPAFHLPRTANGRGVADAWAAASDEEAENPEPIGLLVISGDEAAADPNVQAMAEQAEAVLAIGMFRRVVTPIADLVLPGTSYLERDGTYVNLEGRLQRLRRTVDPAGAGRARGPRPAGGALRRRALALPVAGLRRGLGDRLRRPARTARSARKLSSPRVSPPARSRGQAPGPVPRRQVTSRDCGSSPTARCSPGPRSSASPSSSSSAPTPRSS